MTSSSAPSRDPSAGHSSAVRPTRSPLPLEGHPRVSWHGVLVFCAVAYGILAVCAAPFWVLDGGIAHPLCTVVIAAGMLAPLIASVVVAKLADRTLWRDAVGLRFRGRWRWILLWSPLGPWPSIVLGGTIRSLWHLPVTLLGHNYTGGPVGRPSRGSSPPASP